MLRKSILFILGVVVAPLVFIDNYVLLHYTYRDSGRTLWGLLGGHWLGRQALSLTDKALGCGDIVVTFPGNPEDMVISDIERPEREISIQI